jgi:hypothetical protein
MTENENRWDASLAAGRRRPVSALSRLYPAPPSLSIRSIPCNFPLSSSPLIGNNSRKTPKGHLNETVQLGSGNLDTCRLLGDLSSCRCVHQFVCFNSFIAEQDHRINGEGTSNGDRGSDDVLP